MPLKCLQNLAVAVLVSTTAACSTSPVSSTAQQVAEGGQQYVSTLKKVNVLALDHSLEFTADLLPNLQRTQSTLEEQTQTMRERAQAVSLVNAYLDLQAQYFAQLQALAKGDQTAATQKNVKALADALGVVPNLPGLAAPIKNSVASLAGHVATAAHNREVALVLQRDASVVGQALLFNQQVLDEQIQWMTFREQLAREVAYRDNVEKPYLAEKKLGEAWKKAWMSSIKPPPNIALLEEARQASLRMQQAWLDVLRGQGNMNQLSGVFTELQASIQTLQTRQANP
ncbi:hypothetical protein NQT62_13230 [Limnobacter humi]|uniref:Uncharacterized protein n=1 Tax=Limnobacter humi TaxID=1778671 RepID=A0ABT1WK96_9BURK|nr:hypothetical protein [Limnobacter humi]MCQ8897398.1 hypothetical protein [Limnobacter humi]